MFDRLMDGSSDAFFSDDLNCTAILTYAQFEYMIYLNVEWVQEVLNAINEQRDMVSILERNRSKTLGSKAFQSVRVRKSCKGIGSEDAP